VIEHQLQLDRALRGAELRPVIPARGRVDHRGIETDLLARQPQLRWLATPRMPLRPMLPDRCREPRARKQLKNLAEHAAYSFHGCALASGWSFLAELLHITRGPSLV
jgi:hypothetical protein